MKICFKGQFINIKFLAIYVSTALILAAICMLFYIYRASDFLFKTTGFIVTGPATIMLLLLPAVFIVLKLTILFTKNILPDEVCVLLNQNVFTIYYGSNKREIILKDINAIVFIKRGANWDRISIKTNCTMHINIGDLFKGVQSSEIDNLYEEMKYLLVKTNSYFYEGNSAVENNQSYRFSKKRPDHKSKYLLLGSILVSTFLIIGGAIAAVIYSKNSGAVDIYNEKEIENSHFAIANEKVYVHIGSKGYYEVKNADQKSFEALFLNGEGKTSTGKDLNNVFSAEKLLEDIDIHTIKYLGSNYIRDATSVYYRNRKIKNADAATFEVLPYHYDKFSVQYTFAKDKNAVYYKDALVKNADPHTIKNVDGSFDYIKDSKNAFYRTKILPNVQVENFSARKINYQLLLATDGKRYFVNDLEFPEVARNMYGEDIKVNRSKLKLLFQKPQDFGHLLFSDGSFLYYYDDEKKAFYEAEKIADLSSFNADYFTDGVHLYFCNSGILAQRKFGSYGSQTNIYKSKIKVRDYSSVKNYKSERENAKLLVKIRTKNRTVFEDEID